MFVLSVAESFNYDLYRDLLKKFGTGMATRQSLKSLSRFTFISQPEPDHYALHALVRDALADQHDPDDRQEIHRYLFDRADGMLEEIGPDKPSEVHRRALRDGVTHGIATLEPEALIDWLFDKRTPFHRTSDWKLLGELFEIVVREAELLLGAEHPKTLDAINALGYLLDSQRKRGQAELLYRRALEGRERVLGEDHPDTLTSVNNLGGLLKSRGMLVEAEPLYRRALEGRERVLGGDHWATLMSLNNLGTLRLKQGHDAEALELVRRALVGAVRTLGPNHPHTRKYLANFREIQSVRSD